MNERNKELAVQSELMRKYNYAYSKELQKFADLIRADEREACAAACMNIATKPSNVIFGVAVTCAETIRARGNT